MSVFKLNPEFGTTDNIALLEALIECKNNSIFKTDMQLIIDYKWINLKYHVMILPFIFVIYSILMMAHIIFFPTDEVIMVVLLCFSSLLLGFEIL